MNIDNLVGALQENSETVMVFSQVPQDGAVEARAEFNISGPGRLVKQLAEYFDCTDEKENEKEQTPEDKITQQDVQHIVNDAILNHLQIVSTVLDEVENNTDKY